jgi:hypothetical protein
MDGCCVRNREDGPNIGHHWTSLYGVVRCINGPCRVAGARKRSGKAHPAQKIGGANGFYGLSRPIPQICVVLITIRRHRWLLVKLWSQFFDYLSGMLKLGKDDPLLLLILPSPVGIADLADLIGLKEQDLAQPFVGVDLGG